MNTSTTSSVHSGASRAVSVAQGRVSSTSNNTRHSRSSQAVRTRVPCAGAAPPRLSRNSTGATPCQNGLAGSAVTGSSGAVKRLQRRHADADGTMSGGRRWSVNTNPSATRKSSTATAAKIMMYRPVGSFCAVLLLEGRGVGKIRRARLSAARAASGAAAAGSGSLAAVLSEKVGALDLAEAHAVAVAELGVGGGRAVDAGAVGGVEVLERVVAVGAEGKLRVAAADAAVLDLDAVFGDAPDGDQLIDEFVGDFTRLGHRDF